MAHATLAVAAFLVSVLVKFDIISCVYKWLRCIYYLRKLPLTIRPHWLTGHSRHGHPENAASFIMKSFSGQHLVPGVTRIDLAPFVHFANLQSPDAVGTILRTSEPKIHYLYSFLLPWIGNGLFVSNGKKWSRNRRLLTPAFHFDVLKGYVEVYASAVAILEEKWLGKSRGGGHARVEVSQDVHLLTLDVILRCAMNYTSGCQQQANEYAGAVVSLLQCTNARSLNVLHHADCIYYNTAEGRKYVAACHTAHRYSDKIIKARRKDLASAGVARGDLEIKKRPNFLDILLTAIDSNGQGLTDAEIRDEVDTFLFEGHDTTASALQWTLYFLAGNSHAQERCRLEARTVLGKMPSELATEPETAGVSFDQIKQLRYIEQAVKESLRLATPIPLAFRSLTSDVRIDGHLIPDGAWVLVNLWALHHRPDVWADPMRYDPSRFDRDGGSESTSAPLYSFVPFSGGPRNCIGQNLAMAEMKVVIALLLLRFRFAQPADMEDMGQRLYGVSRPERPIELLIERVPDAESTILGL